MINLSGLNRLLLFFFILLYLSFSNFSFAEEDPVDIWTDITEQDKRDTEIGAKQKVQSPILSKTLKTAKIEIDEEQVDTYDNTIVGLFDPEENDFDLNMWTSSNGKDVKDILKRLNKLKLSKFSEDLMFRVLFTNSFAPQKNLSSDEFLDIKIKWLIKNERVQDLEKVLKLNPEVGKKPKAISFLIEEYLSLADIKSACKNASLIDKDLQNDYLDKFNIYCLINEDRRDEAQLLFDLTKERGLQDSFFENKINFLLGYNVKKIQKIHDDNLLNFYLSQITIEDFHYKPTAKTNKYIWKYLTSANLLSIKDLEDETIIEYEKAASEGTFEKKDIFNIYKKVIFNFNQLLNATEVYKTLPNHKSRALIYQSVLLSDDDEIKLKLTFLLKDLFEKDKLYNLFSEEFLNILKSIDENKIPSNYLKLVKAYSSKNLHSMEKIKYDNNIIHRSKILKYFFEDDYELKNIEKDFNSVYKKVKKNKKYFISIKDIVILESLSKDGIKLPKDLNMQELSSKLTVPEGLINLATTKQIGLALLKIIEIIGEDDIRNLDPETIYFLNRILNELNLKKIRNNILIASLPARV